MIEEPHSQRVTNEQRSEPSIDLYEVEIPDNIVPMERVVQIEGMVLSGARRVRFAVQRPVMTFL